MPTLATFNANNFFLRYKFSRTYPGDLSKNSMIEAAESAIGYMPGVAFGKYSPKNYIVWDPIRRELAGEALKEPDGRLPDILCFQEVENIQAIRAFNQRYLNNYYKYSLLIDGYDPRNIDVGILSRYPIIDIQSHIDDTRANQRIFSRDCLEATIKLPGKKNLTIFLNHFKSKLVKKKKNDTEAQFHANIRASHMRRQRQAEAVAELISNRFKNQHDTAWYAVIGDFNDTAYSPYLKALIQSRRLTDIVRKHRGTADSWTYYWRSKNRVSQIDFILASRALTDRVDLVVKANKHRTPYIERGGLAYKQSSSASAHILPASLVHFEKDPVTPTALSSPPMKSKIPFDFARYEPINKNWKNNISDHCPVKIWF